MDSEFTMSLVISPTAMFPLAAMAISRTRAAMLVSLASVEAGTSAEIRHGHQGRQVVIRKIGDQSGQTFFYS